MQMTGRLRVLGVSSLKTKGLFFISSAEPQYVQFQCLLVRHFNRAHTCLHFVYIRDETFDSILCLYLDFLYYFKTRSISIAIKGITIIATVKR